VIRHRAFRVAILMTALTLTACDVQTLLRPNPLQEVADGMVGKPIQVAIQHFGRPDFGPTGSLAGAYMWNHTSFGPPKTVAVQKEVGKKIIAFTQEQNGVAGQPIYQSQYQVEYEQQQSLKYICMIQIIANLKGIITSASVSGCRDTSLGY